MRAALVGELMKIRTVRAQVLAVLLGVLAIPVASLLVTASDGLSPHDSVTSGAATGTLVGLLAFGSWAAAVAAGEYGRATMVVSLATVPRRTTLYTAKLAALTATAAAGALGSVLVSFAVVWATVPRGVHPLGDPAALLAVVPAVVAVTAIGVAAGIWTRSSTAAIGVVLAVVLLPQTAAGLLGGLQPWVVGASPAVVVTQLVGNTQLTAAQTYPAGAVAAVATLLAVAAGIAVGGGSALARRDG